MENGQPQGGVFEILSCSGALNDDTYWSTHVTAFNSIDSMQRPLKRCLSVVIDDVLFSYITSSDHFEKL